MRQKRSTTVTMTSLKFSLHLILSSDGSCRMTRQAPHLNRDERVLHLDVTVPRAMFETPTMRAAIVVPDVGSSPQIDIKEVEGALRSALGIDVHVKVEDEAQSDVDHGEGSSK